jgi:hypothetical protein
MTTCATCGDVPEYCPDSRNQYTPGYSYVVTGYDDRGLSAYYARNVTAARVPAVLHQATLTGWTNLTAGREYL